MNEKQALDVLKSALDLATQKGVFPNLESSAAIIQAFNVISEKLLSKDDKQDAEHTI